MEWKAMQGTALLPAVAVRLRDQADDVFAGVEQGLEGRFGEGAGPHHDDSHG